MMRLFMYLFSLSAGIGVQVDFFNIYGNFSLADLIIILFVPICLVVKNRLVVTKEGKELSVIIFLLAMWQLFSLLFSSWLEIGNLGPNIRLFYYGVIVLIFSSLVQEPKHLENLSKSYLLGVVINLVYSLYLWSLEPNYWGGIFYLNNTYVSRNPLYYYLVFSIPISLGLAESNRTLFKNFYYLSAIILSIVSFFTFSKGAWAAVLLIWTIFLIFNFKNIFSSTKYIIPLALILLIIFLGLNTINLKEVIEAVEYRLFSSYQTNMGRLKYLTRPFEMGMDNFFRGVGLSNFRYAVSRYDSLERTSDPHNVYGMIFAETGFIGLLIYLIFILVIIFYLRALFNYIRLNKTTTIYWRTSLLIFVLILFLNLLTGMAFNGKFLYFTVIYIMGSLNLTKDKI